MPRFYFHLRDHVDAVLDEEGIELADMPAVKAKSLLSARGVMAGDLAMGMLDLRYRIDVEDEANVLVYTLPFKHAVQIIPE